MKVKIVYLVLFILTVGLVYYMGEWRGVGHGSFEFPIEVTTEKEIKKAEYRFLAFLTDSSEELTTNHEWRELREEENGLYLVSVPFSSGSKGGFLRETKVNYLHSAGIAIKLTFLDGSDLTVTSPLQPHPRQNTITIETN